MNPQDPCDTSQIQNSWSIPISGRGMCLAKLWCVRAGPQVHFGVSPPPATPQSCVKGDIPKLRGSMDVPRDVFDPDLAFFGCSIPRWVTPFSPFLQGSALPREPKQGSLSLSSFHLSQHLPCCPCPGLIKVNFCPSLLYPIRGIKAGASGPKDLPCDSRSFFRLRPH